MLEIAQYGAVFIYPEDETGIEHMLKNEGYCLNQQLPFDTDERQECQKFLTGMPWYHSVIPLKSNIIKSLNFLLQDLLLQLCKPFTMDSLKGPKISAISGMEFVQEPDSYSN